MILISSLLIIFILKVILITDMPFNEETWKNNHSVRYRMIEDLKKKNLKIGEDQEEIYLKLGKPDDYINGSSIYYCGYGEFREDLVVMHLNFNNNKLIKVKIN